MKSAPRTDEPLPPLSPERVIAMALSTIPYVWSGRMLSETSEPVRQVMKALDTMDYEIRKREGT